MQIRPLKIYSINSQLGLKGSVVNIPIEINDILQELPRNFDNMATIQIKLKRHVLHSTDYMFETIRPAVVCEALNFLVNTPLYKKYNITINEEFFSKYEKEVGKEIEFIVEVNDISEPEQIKEIHQNLINDYAEEDIDNAEIEEEVLVIDQNKQINNCIKIIAPGQGKQPVPWHAIPDLEELCFPTIFAGNGVEFKNNVKISYTDRVKSESRRLDRRSCVSTRVLYMAKKKMEITCLGNINMCLRKSKTKDNLTAKDVRNSDYLNSLINIDSGYKILNQVRSSPSYWETRKKEILAMIRQLGKPTIFLTLSAGEKIWPELLQALMKLNRNQNITLEEAYNLDECEKTKLIRDDPVTCARYFDFKIQKFMQMLKSDSSIFEEFEVIDSYSRVEFQMRGSPHEHILLWLKNAPDYNLGEIDRYIEFIDRFITCEYDANNPYVSLQFHKHTHTCHKGKQNKNKCRFNFPIPVMPRTMILVPLIEEKKSDELKNHLNNIRKEMQHLYKSQQAVSFEDILSKLNISESLYILAIRSSLKRVQIFVKRSSLEVALNLYNKKILSLFEANMDIQYITEEYGLAAYIINYISKIDSGLSKLLRDAASDATNGNMSIKEKFRKIANVFINNNLMSAQEAAYHVLSLPLSKMSRQCIFINTSPIKERVMMLKNNQQLLELNDDTTEIFQDNIFKKYSERKGASVENKCLADFAALYYKSKKLDNSNENEINDDEEELAKAENYNMREKSKILRYHRYQLQKDPRNYYRAQILLFLAWENELEEIENVDHELKYKQNYNIINENRKKYLIIGEELDLALENAMNEINEVEEEYMNDFENDKLSIEQQVDILEQGGKEKPSNSKNLNRFSIPQRISKEDLYSLIQKLNNEQKLFVMHVLQSVKTKVDPLRIFLSGSAGVGKSTVINSLYQLITNYHDNMPGDNKDKIVVLLCAPSGKAAFLIQGVTLHTAFALPVSQFGGQMPELSSDIANTIRHKLFHLKLLIIDEISMVGSTLFSRVDTRLRQIMGNDRTFGGISVICVGDLNQLPPVMDSPIFKMSNSNEMNALFDTNPLWDEFNYYELTQIMRQKDEVRFINCLNNLAVGKLTEEDIKLIKSREVKEDEVPIEAIRLFSENLNVDLYNELKISKCIGEEYISEAVDTILGKVTDKTKRSVLSSLAKKKTSEMNGLPYKLRLKVGIKYMVTCNLDVEDGLVNGSCGVLKLITFKINTTDPLKLWLDFNSEVVGNKARLLQKEHMREANIDSKLTPMSKFSSVLNISNKLQHQVTRLQFPITPAEGLTIHKSQGQTYNAVCIDLRQSKRVTRSMLYVALSRVTKLSGLYILGNFKCPKLKRREETLEELQKLKTTKQLVLLNSLEPHSGIKITYLNITSFKNLENVTTDQWYLQGDILIFSETLSSPSDVIDIPNFHIVFRSDSTGKSRGLVCLVKNKYKNDALVDHYVHNIKEEYHFELFSLTIFNFTVISGYKSPGVPNLIFEVGFKEILNSVVDNNKKQEVVLLGDFNFNVIGSEQTYFSKFLSSFNLHSRLPSDTQTTNLRTQIDVIFSTFSEIETGIYETYFTYHKAIYCILNHLSSNESHIESK
jgi:hypothetical protein